MDRTTFDRTISRLAPGVSRRQVFSALLGAAAMLSGGVASAKTAGGGKGKAKGKGKGKDQRNAGARGNGSDGNSGDNGLAKGTTKVSLCHKDLESGDYQFITVAEPAWQGHERHGDVICATDPCADAAEGCSVVCTPEGACVAASSEDEGSGEDWHRIVVTFAASWPPSNQEQPRSQRPGLLLCYLPFSADSCLPPFLPFLKRRRGDPGSGLQTQDHPSLATAIRTRGDRPRARMRARGANHSRRCNRCRGAARSA